MKKKIIIIILIIAFIIGSTVLGVYSYLNYRDEQISLINENVVIEYGEGYNPNINDLIDVGKYSFIDLNKINIKNELVNEEEKDYPKVGEYFIHIYYKNIELVQKIEVKDSISPEVTVDEKIELPYNADLESYDFNKHVKVNDLSEMKEYNIDYSNVNREIAGEYTAKLEVEDIYNNKTQKEFKIIIQEKVEEPITNETPSNNVKNETTTTSNQTKAQSNNKSTQSSQKAPSTTNNKPVNSNTQTQTSTGTNANNNNQSQQVNTPYYCVEGGSHHLSGDGANEHGYYGTWDAAFSAYENYTAGWESTQFKVDQCPCGKYYFWAIK